MIQRLALIVLLFAFVVTLNAQAPSAPGKPLPPGPAQGKIKATCTQCHDTSRITEQNLTRQQWTDELAKMEGLGAVVQEADRATILNYLAKNFGAKGGAKTAVKKASGGAN